MQHTNHRKHAPAFRQHFQTTRQVFRRVGIMGDIKDNARRLTHDLKTSRQGSLRNTVANRLFVNVQPAGAQRGQSGGGIRLGNLRQRQSGKRAVAIGKRPVGRCHLITPVNAATQQQRAGLLRDIRDGCRHFRFADDSGFFRTKNPGFLAADTFAIRPQPVSMVKRDAGNYRYIGIHNVRGVQAPAQPDLQNHHVKVSLFKQPQCRQRTIFKIGQ